VDGIVPESCLVAGFCIIDAGPSVSTTNELNTIVLCHFRHQILKFRNSW
jgi:hypothetical protein